MEKTTLQHVIESKYNIYEPLLVEGLFVSLVKIKQNLL